jgi:hypothetical protein
MEKPNKMKPSKVIVAGREESRALAGLLTDHSPLGGREAQLAAFQAQRAEFEAARAIRRAGLTAKGKPVQPTTLAEAGKVRDAAHHPSLTCADPSRCQVCKK